MLNYSVSSSRWSRARRTTPSKTALFGEEKLLRFSLSSLHWRLAHWREDELSNLVDPFLLLHKMNEWSFPFLKAAEAKWRLQSVMCKLLHHMEGIESGTARVRIQLLVSLPPPFCKGRSSQQHRQQQLVKVKAQTPTMGITEGTAADGRHVLGNCISNALCVSSSSYVALLLLLQQQQQQLVCTVRYWSWPSATCRRRRQQHKAVWLEEEEYEVETREPNAHRYVTWHVQQSTAQHNTTRQGWMDGWIYWKVSIGIHTHAPRLLLLLPSSSLLFHCAVLCCSALFCSETDAQVTHAHTWPAARPLPLPSCSFVRSFFPCNNASVQSLTSGRWVWSKSL